ncbi:MAG: M23 family metallopeptidase [Candidatus Niyogibacteria bacterium]|nr:M23 family metallopeptidase [Candidatus Niyogibacteria bacterium]
MFKGETETETAAIFNSQTIPLLEAPTNVDPLAGTGGGDITIVQNNALLAATGPLGSIADIEESAKANGQISIYVVREGDSLSAIAKMFGVSVNTIVWANDLNRTDLIKTGQVLVILPISGVQYTVAKGDTIQSIAKKFKGDADEIAQFNDLSAPGILAIGSTVIIPNGESYLVSTPTSRLRSAGGPEYPGYYLRPIAGGRRSQGLHGYNGIDLAASCGTPVLASASGDVIVDRSYGWNGGYGLYTVVRHPNSTQTLYAHLSSVIVQAGWPVVQGQVIGYVGSTGNSTGCHLHFEVRGAKNPF